MEPLKPSFREALKEEHEGLTDEEIDEVEDLIAERFRIDPEAEPLRIQELDRRREEILRTKIPKAQQVFQKQEVLEKR
jgi:hypothetical protein